MSADPEVLRGLLKRVKAAQGPDRTLDVRILALLQQPGEWSASDIEYACTNPERICSPPRYTASVDAALDLAERLFPKMWKDMLRGAMSDLAKRHSWHMCFAKPGQREELPRAIIDNIILTLLVDHEAANVDE